MRVPTPGHEPALLLILLLVLAPARATAQVGPPEDTPLLELVDPLDGHRFYWPVVPAVNGLGGSDSDGCAYSRGQQPRTWNVATSPTTLYSARMQDWDRPIPEQRKEGLLAMLLAIGRDVDDATHLPPYQRYRIAAATAEYLGDGPFELGEIHLEGAWTVRDSIVGFLPGVRGAADAWKKLEEVLPAMRALEDPSARTIACFDLARLCHRGGFGRERDALLAATADIPDAGLGAKEKRAEFLRRVGQEGLLLASARDAFLAGIREGRGDAEERAFYRYLVADISRRLGDLAAADGHVDALLADEAAGEEVRERVLDIKAVLAVQDRDVPSVPPAGSGEGRP